MDKTFLAELKAQTQAPQIFKEEGGKDFLVAHESSKVHDLEQFRAHPSRIEESANFTELQSFIAYVNQFKTESSAIFGKRNSDNSVKVTAILDYHAKDAPKWGSHVATMNFTLSDEFNLWKKVSDTFIKQSDFADFLEANLHHIVEPDAATMLEIATYLEGTRNRKFRSGKRLDNGAITFELDEEIEIKSRIPNCPGVPKKLVVAIPVYENTKPTTIDLLFRHRITDDGLIVFSYSFVKLPEIIRDAFKENVETITRETATPVFWGSV